MADLLLNWLNDEVQLSKRITSFEDDFHNGYLLGELLAKHSQQLNFHQFVNSDDKASRVKNFSLLLDSLAALRVAFDSNLAMNVINRKPGVAKKLLYELKTQLERTNANHFSRSARSNRTLSPLKKIQIAKQKFDQVNKEHFVKQLNQLHPSQKQIIQERHLRKFKDAQQQNEAKAAVEEENARQAKLMLRTRNNLQLRDTLKKSEQFRQQWQAENQQKWAANIQIRAVQVAKDQKFKQTIFLKKSQSHFNQQTSALKSIQSDIADFQKRNGLGDDSDQQEKSPSRQSGASRPVRQSQINQISLKPFKAQQTQERRLGANQADKKRHLREKRRRKMIVQQQKRYQMIEITRRQRIILNTVEQISKQEKELQYQIWRAWQNKNVICDNCNLQAEKIKQKEQVRSINTKFKRDQLLKVQRQQHKAEVKASLFGNTLLERKDQVSHRKDIYKQCEKMVYKILGLTEDLYEQGQKRNSSVIDKSGFQSASLSFVNDDEVDIVRHYIEGLYEWSVPITRAEESIPTDPVVDNALPDKNVNNQYLGNILKTVFTKLQAKPQQAKDQKSKSQKTIISLVGLDFAGINVISKLAQQDFQFTPIELDKLIQKRLQEWRQLKEKGLQVSSDTQQLAQSCFNGQTISQDLTVRLLAEEINQYNRVLLLDFPNTYEQAVALSAALGAQKPFDLQPRNKLQTKIEDFQKLAKASQTNQVPRQLRSCGIDFVWWVELSPSTSLDRALGRRWIEGQQVHINDDIQPQNLQQKEKAAALISRNNFKLKHKEHVKKWFSMFGLNFGQQSRTCWEEINGTCSEEDLIKVFSEKFSDLLAFKKKQVEWGSQQQQQKVKKQQQAQEQNKRQEDIKQKCAYSAQDHIKGKLKNALNAVDLNRDFLQKMGAFWNTVESSTLQSLKQTLKSLGLQQKDKLNYLALRKKAFIMLLSRQDQKAYLIKQFQRKYNEFSLQSEDMLPYDYAKEQLHQRVEDLQSDLLQIVEDKKEDAVTERTAVMSSGWLEAQLENLSQSFFVLIQTQLNRYSANQKLITDFYGKKYMANTKSFEPLNGELNAESWAALDIFKDGSSPRLQKMVSQGLRIMNRQEDITEDKNKKGGKGAPPPKKDDKKGGKNVVEQPKQPTPQELELKKAINTEKAILRLRLNRIKNYGKNKLSEVFQATKKMYGQLEDLYIYTHRVQTQAIMALTKIFKRAIEREQRIQDEVRLQYVEVRQSQRIRNFEKIIPVVEAARQGYQDQHITVSSLRDLLKLFQGEAEGSRIHIKKLQNLLNKIVSNRQLKMLLSSTWRQLTSTQIQQFVKLINHRNQAYVELNQVFLFLILSRYSLPSAQQTEDYRLKLSKYQSISSIDRKQFSSVPAWFDQALEQLQNVRVFDRNSLLKQLLFDIFAHDGQLDITAFVSHITLQDYVYIKEAGDNQTYYQYAFS